MADTRPGFLADPKRLALKPKHGEPCTSCGLCCEATLCPLAMKLFKRERGPCPALQYDSDQKSHCGLVTNPMAYAMRVTLEHGKEKTVNAALLLISSGQGCDARFNGEKPDPAFYEKLRNIDRQFSSEISEAKKVWGIR